jgi:hypothetical protein
MLRNVTNGLDITRIIWKKQEMAKAVSKAIGSTMTVIRWQCKENWSGPILSYKVRMLLHVKVKVKQFH